MGFTTRAYTDCIKIQNLEIYANHGLFPEETKLGQKFLVSAMLYVDTHKAGMTDAMEDSVDYGDVCHYICNYLQKNTFHLLEAAAESLATQLLKDYKLIRGVTLSIKKPWAPIGLPLDYVEIEITRKWNKAYLGIGSNLGDKEGYLKLAIEKIRENTECQVIKTSDFIETKPVGHVEQDDFLNGCIEIETLLTPYELLTFVNEIEMAAGRTREIHWGPRTLDIDILLYEDVVMWKEKLKIPHPYMDVREFVLEPLTQIAPYAVHGTSGKTIMALWNDIKEKNKLEN